MDLCQNDLGGVFGQFRLSALEWVSIDTVQLCLRILIDLYFFSDICGNQLGLSTDPFMIQAEPKRLGFSFDVRSRVSTSAIGNIREP